MAIIKSVSLTKEHAEMCERDGVSLSAVLRTALEQLHLYKTGELLDDLGTMNRKLIRLSEDRQKFFDFLNEKGLFEEFHGILEQKA